MQVFTNARVFDGRSAQLRDGLNVFVEGERITEVSDRPAPPGAAIIDSGGRVLMPGLIDAHIHIYLADINVEVIARQPPTYYAHYGARTLRNMLDRGFTTVRDTGGGDYGMQLALERGLVTGPRLFISGRALSQTGGHGDFRHPHHHDHGGDMLACGCGTANHVTVVVDGVTEVRKAVRENLRRGASFIKFMGSGGVSSISDPLEAMQFSDEEIRAIVDEVERHGAYCTAHILADAAIRRAITLGVHCIEHGVLIEPETARLAAERGTYIVPTLAIVGALARRGAELGYPPEALAKLDSVKDQALTRLAHMRDAGVKLGFGTDLMGDLEGDQCTEFTLRAAVFSPFEILHQATAMNGEILGQKDRLGVIAPGAFADILLVDGNPLDDIAILAANGANLALIMRGGKLHRDRRQDPPS